MLRRSRKPWRSPAPLLQKKPPGFVKGRGRFAMATTEPTSRELRALGRPDVTPDHSREIDRLYDELMTKSEKARRRIQRPAGDRGLSESRLHEHVSPQWVGSRRTK
jgi:hypothetical protein